MKEASEIRLFQTESDFWTTDDEVDHRSNDGSSDASETRETSLPSSSAVKEQPDETEADASSKEAAEKLSPVPAEPGLSEANSGSAETEKNDILRYEKSLQEEETEPTLHQEFIPNQSPIPRKGYVRKRWIIEDDSDVQNFHERLPDMAIAFPFELDPFQKRAILHLEQNHHVFVAAHTSAGKTVVAEYAIALALKRQRRVVYTSPVKALSNQKYLEFKQKFSSVGIITGDVSINPEAACVIMTTEILRSALYMSSAIIESLDSVIFDEVHYINDSERGVVWEEVILLLPDSVNMVMLSATAPNYKEFADWIGRARQRDVFAVLTLKRPVPLKHYTYFDDKIFLLMDSTGSFKASAYNEMYQYARKKQQNQYTEVVQQKGKAPVKVKNQKSVYQTNTSKMKTDTRRLRDLIRKLEKQALSTLCEDDRQLPQIRSMEDLLKAGVGVHHGGLLPLMKEVMEILFSRGLISILFATETFAMGVNMPARSVIFSSITKHDGTKMRPLLPSEYTQMAGRAGRRGLDVFGNVYIFCSNVPPDQKDLTLMMISRSTPLLSQFRVTFVMILQLIKSSAVRIEDMMRKSFRESSRLLKQDVAERNYKRLQKKHANMRPINCILGDPTIEEYVEIEMQSREIANELHSPRIFCAGRVIIIHSIPSLKASCVAIILSTDETSKRQPNAEPSFTCLVLISSSLPEEFLSEAEMHPNSSLSSSRKSPSMISNASMMKLHSQGWISSETSVDFPSLFNQREYRIYRNVSMSTISLVATAIVTEAEKLNITDVVAVSIVARKLEHLLSETRGKLVPLANDKSFKHLQYYFFEIIALQRKNCVLLQENKCHTCPKKEEHFRETMETRQCVEDIEEIGNSMREESLECYRSMKEKSRILQMLGLIDENYVLTLKGQVATIIMTGDDLLLPEAIFENVLQDLSPEEVACVLAAFSGCETVEEQPFPTAAVLNVMQKITAINAKLLAILNFDVMEISKSAFAKMLNPSFCYVAYLWASGAPFSKIMENTSTQEGTIVRCLLRLDEIIKKLKLAMIIMGNEEMEKILQSASTRIHRDIIFNMSLYLQ
ncbi:DEAD/DEAH box helicase domain-containing protein [Cardiosporidium cionae]|uniref:DEAD/DEAH box helicase domain-containing protein n=1 Tax=Cardiosporidium cionae TaxID=476202 RepID=A0ABQ7JAU0_9APIC|nr:DEAD/DEAH box helicase domain-containing protein [Cardiosporidium cionae]|eukprot:KAF8821070.1 DEAD/DEAH box helicase domain-containing protein [Cardiosporidium cionae]